MFYVCSLLVMSESPFNLSCTKNASKLATWNKQRSLRNYSKDIGDALHSAKIKVGSCQNHPTRPETGKNWKTYQNRTLPIKSSLEGNEGNMGEIGEIWKVRKITIEEIVRNPAKGMSSLLHHSNMSHFHHVRSKPFVPVTTATGIPSANCGNWALMWPLKVWLVALPTP